MNKLSLLQKLAPVGVAAFGAISVIGIQAVPAQAVGFTSPVSSLEWDDTTDSFVAEATDVFNAGAAGVGVASFDVTFSPVFAGGVANVGIATGDFDPFFDNPPPDQVPIVPPNSAFGTFVLDTVPINPPSPPADPAIVLAAGFELQDNLIFTFDTTVNGVPGPVTATLPGGSTFLGELKDDGAVEFELEAGQWEFTLPDGSFATAVSSEFEFGQTFFSPGGGYQAEGDVVHDGGRIPEPATIFGLLTVGGLGLRLKRKKQA